MIYKLEKKHKERYVGFHASNSDFLKVSYAYQIAMVERVLKVSFL